MRKREESERESEGARKWTLEMVFFLERISVFQSVSMCVFWSTFVFYSACLSLPFGFDSSFTFNSVLFVHDILEGQFCLCNAKDKIEERTATRLNLWICNLIPK